MAQAAVHRTPWALIIAAVVILIVLMAGCGTALALLGGKPSNGSPDATPAPASPAALLGPTASNPVVTVPVPAGWTVTAKDNESITLTDPNAWGYVTVASGVQNPKQTVQQQKASIDASIKSKSPDAIECRAVRPTPGTIGGKKGITWHLCFTVISSGKSLAAEASLFVATNADGSVYYGVVLLTPQSYMTNLSREAEPLLAGIQWKLT
jgi:hypothetical protein